MKIASFIRSTFKRYFVIGLIVIFPFAVTIKFFTFFINYLDQILEIQNGRFLYFIPARFHPDTILGIPLPGLGVVFSLLIVLFVGALSRNYFGRRFIRWGDRNIAKIPMARVIYNVVKQALQTYVTRDKAQFSRVVLIEYPRSGSYTLAFVTGSAPKEIQKKLGGPLLNVFVPTTPNPTSGYYLIIPVSSVIDLDISVEDAFKLVISGGMVTGENTNPGELVDAL